MEKVDVIWDFLEKKLKSSIPNYFKNVLKACGFDNGITISSIDEDDLQYLQQEVRNGNVSKYFAGIDNLHILEGSTKNFENFEFPKGHKKFLLAIRDVLKKCLEEKVPDLFLPELALKPRAAKHKIRNPKPYAIPKKRRKCCAAETDSTPLEFDDFQKEKRILITKALTSLINHTPTMYVEACVKDIDMHSSKTSAGLVILEINKSLSEISVLHAHVRKPYAAKIVCPICSEAISVPQSYAKRSNENIGKPWWNMSGFNRHLKETHKTYNLEEHFESIDREVKPIRNTDIDGVANEETSKEKISINCGSGMLQRFVSTAEVNSTRKKQGYRFNPLMKMFAAYMKMIAGRLAYETLHANFPTSLPSMSTVNRFIADNGPQIVEGEMRADELLQYLESRNLPLKISISEDATRITPKISYDPRTNQLAGFALPLDTNGMPITSSFPARNIREIQKHYANDSNFVSSNAFVQMAQPIDLHSPPFCCMIFSTDCRYTALNIYRRWRFQALTLKGKGITINNIASDGDPRSLMAMKVLSRIGQQDLSYLDCEWFSCGGMVETTFTQDYVHIITKSRNRILTCSRLFPIGKKIVSSTHLKYLIEHVSKDKHLLTYSDIQPKDRQNFLSAEKICSEKTIKCLSDYVPESEGTIMYLRMMRSVLNAFTDIAISSKERIYEIWYAVFFCRAWRSWLLNSEMVKADGKKKAKHFYNLKDNFLSPNCYTCIELNAHALVKQVLIEETLSESSGSKNSKIFFPNLFDSQVCESMFRQLRSFCSTFCTVVNFNILDIIHRIRKIQLQNEIIKSCNDRIKFPRFEKKSAGITADCNHQLEYLTSESLILQIEKAKKAVSDDMEALGVDTTQLNFHCQVEPASEEDLVSHEVETDYDSDFEELSEFTVADFFDDTEEEKEEEFLEDVNFLSGITGELMLKEYNPRRKDITDVHSDRILLDERSIFVVVTDNNGKDKVVRKSAVCYVLSKDKHKLSSDRLRRVQEKEYGNTRNPNTKSIPDANSFIKNEDICIGNWCIFSSDEKMHSIKLGLVLEFRYLIGKTFKEKEYSKSSAPVQSVGGKKIGLLCNFYSFNDNGVLSSCTGGIDGDKHKFIDIGTYVGSIKDPIYANKMLTITPELVIELKKLNND